MKKKKYSVPELNISRFMLNGNILLSSIETDPNARIIETTPGDSSVQSISDGGLWGN